MSEPPPLINWIAAISGILGISIFSVIGWIIGNIPSLRSRNRERQPPPPVRDARQRGQGRISVMEEVRGSLYHWIVQTDVPVATHALVAVVGAVSLAVVISFYVFSIARVSNTFEPPIFSFLRTLNLIGIAILAVVVIFAFARLRWRIRYEQWLRDQEGDRANDA